MNTNRFTKDTIKERIGQWIDSLLLKEFNHDGPTDFSGIPDSGGGRKRMGQYPLTHQALNHIHGYNGWDKLPHDEIIPRHEEGDWKASEDSLSRHGHHPGSVEQGIDDYFENQHQNGADHHEGKKVSGLPDETWDVLEKNL